MVEQAQTRSVWKATQRFLRSIAVPLGAVVLALIIGAIIIEASGASAWKAYEALAQGAFGNARGWQRTLEKSTPLILSGLAVAFAFKAGLFNIGAQGQLLFGAITAAWVGFAIHGLPVGIHAAVALAAGALVAGLYGAIPGALKTYTGAHEVITTIMLNYVAMGFTDYLANGPLKDRTPGNIVARTPQILDSAKLPTWGWLPFGFLLAVAAAAVAWWILQRTTLGFEIRTVGQNPHAARYAGMKVARTIILTMVISAIFAGIGGAVETQGVVGRYEPGFNANLGFDGITVALLGKTDPFGVIPAALLLGAMRAGSNQMQFKAHVAQEITDVVQALMLFFVAADMIVRWLLRMKAAEEGEKITLSTGWGSH